MANEKGIERLTVRLKRVLNGRLLMTRSLRAARYRRGLVVTVMTVEPENLQILDLEIACARGRGLAWRYELAGRVSSHAAARYIERCGEPDISLVTIAESAVLTLRFVRQLRRFDDISLGMVFTSRIVPVPDVGGDMVAIIDVTEGEVITYIGRKTLRGPRAEWLAKFNAYDANVKSGDIVIETQAPGYVALLNEGAAVWEATRSKSEAAA